MLASCEGHADIIEELLEAKADPNITDEVKLHHNYLVCDQVASLIMYVHS